MRTGSAAPAVPLALAEALDCEALTEAWEAETRALLAEAPAEERDARFDERPAESDEAAADRLLLRDDAGGGAVAEADPELLAASAAGAAWPETEKLDEDASSLDKFEGSRNASLYFPGSVCGQTIVAELSLGLTLLASARPPG
jgi:hypothetical protein